MCVLSRARLPTKLKDGTCLYCPAEEAFFAPTKPLLQCHIRYVHFEEPGFLINCKYSSCHRKFRNYRTYQNHLLEHKKSETHPQVQPALEAQVEEEPMESMVEATNNDLQFVNFSEGRDVSYDFTDFCAKWILKTAETRKLTRYATLGILQDVNDLVQKVYSPKRSNNNRNYTCIIMLSLIRL